MIEQNSKDTSNIQLSLCMIVKNEEKTLGSCLDSVKDIVDEMIILDTGSSDNTIQIAKRFGADIYHFEWCDDFSAARNESIKFAKGMWILWMDADEQFDNSSKEELNSIIKLSRHPMGVNINIRNLSSKNESYGTAYRLFSNHFGIHFKNIIHEQVSYSLKEMKAEIINSNIIIDHFGYDEVQYDQKKKRQRNLPLLQRMIDDNPDDFFPQFVLGQHYSLDKKTQEEAIYHLEKFLNMNSNENKLIASAYTTLADIYFLKNDLYHAKIKVEKSLETAPNQLVAFYQFAKIEFAQKQYQKAVDYLEILLGKINNIRSFKSGNALDTVFTKNHISGFFIKIMMFNLNKEKSFRLIVDLWMTCKGYGEMSQIFYEWNDFERDKFIQIVVGTGYSESHWKILNEISGFLHLMKKDYDRAFSVFQNLFDHNHRNIFTIKSLAGIHAKMGRMDEAAALVKTIS